MTLSAPPRARDRWPEPPGSAAYRGLAGEFVERIREETEADEVALLAQFLIGFGNLIGRRPHCRVGADRHHANEFALLIGPTSRGRKGTSWSQSCRPLRYADPEWARARTPGGLSSGEGLIWAVRDPIITKAPVREKGRIVDYEDQMCDSGVADKRLLVFEPEFASVLRVMRRDGSTLSAVVRQAWDSGSLSVLTKNAQAKASDAHISIVGHITCEELLRHLDRTEAANGFMNRFLLLMVRRSRVLPDGGQFDELDLGDLFERVRRAIAKARAIEVVSRAEDARKLWNMVYPELTEGQPGLVGAVTSRGEAHVVRLSLLYALLDGADTITREHLSAALALWEYAAASARHVFGETLGDPLAETLLRMLRSSPEGLTRSDLIRRTGSHRQARELNSALQELQGQNLVRFQEVPTRGRRATRWFATSLGAETESPGLSLRFLRFLRSPAKWRNRSMSDLESLIQTLAVNSSRLSALPPSEKENLIAAAQAALVIVSESPFPGDAADLLTVSEAAGLLKVNPRWLYRHARKLPFTRRLSRKVLRFSRSALERWVERQRS